MYIFHLAVANVKLLPIAIDWETFFCAEFSLQECTRLQSTLFENLAVNTFQLFLLLFIIGQSHDRFYTAECQGCDVILALSAGHYRALHGHGKTDCCPSQ
jgi:hypothetical protein